MNVFNLGQSMTAGQRYQAGQLALGEQKNVLANRKKAAEIRQQYERMPDEIDALEKAGLHDQAAQVRDHYIKTQVNSIKLMESAGSMVGPEDYKPLRSNLVKAGADGSLIPVDYKDYKSAIEKQKGNINRLTRRWAQNGAVMSQDLITQDGKIMWEGKPIEKKDKGGITISPDGTVQIGGSVEPTRTTQNKLQKELVSRTESLARMQQIRKTFDPKFLTYGGKIKNFVSKVKDKAGSELSTQQRDQLKQYRRFTQSVNFEFNAYRKEITGAAAAVKELEDLKKAMISEDLSPVQFEAAYEEYMGELSRSVRLRNKLMREGFTEPRAMGKQLDSLFILGADDDVDSRGRELEAQGMSPEQIVQTLEIEGYSNDW